MRELVKLFGTPETTDDIGMGQLRDAISNSLFPGTSVLHLGARYMLLVPWAYQTVHHVTRKPDELRKRAEESERQLIERFRERKVESFIGRDAGRNVRQLPSAAYWSALRRYGIVNPETDRSAVAQLMCADTPTPEEGENAYYIWNQSLPKPPEGFPHTDERGLTLSHEEARWLQERILTTCPGTMLTHVVHQVSVKRGLFHPKVWLLEFENDTERRYRFLCSSRNLTTDASWDLLVRLDGEPVQGTEYAGPDSAPLARFTPGSRPLHRKARRRPAGERP